MAKGKNNSSAYVATYPIRFNKADMDMVNRLMKQRILLQNATNNKITKIYNYVITTKEYLKIEKDYKDICELGKNNVNNDNVIASIIDGSKSKNITKELAYKNAREKFFSNFEIDFKGNKGNMIKVRPFTEFGVMSYVSRYKSNFPYINSLVAANIAGDIYRQWCKVIENPETIVKFKSSKHIDKCSVAYLRSGKFIVGVTLSENLYSISFKLGKKTVVGHVDIRKSEYNAYVLDAIKNNNFNVIRLTKSKVRGKDYYQIQITIKGTPYNKMRSIGNGLVGIDLGVSTVVAYGTGELEMLTLNNNLIDFYQEKKAKIQIAMDQSRRATNPDNYNADGTIKKTENCERLVWKCSKHYDELKAQLAELERLRAYHRKEHQNKIANRLIEMGNTFIVEDNNIKAMSKRAKETTVNKKTGKVNSKKRMGKSIGNNAPSQLISILEHKVNVMGGTLKKVSCKGASTQFDFTDGTFTKREGNERTVVLSNGNVHTRDAIAAFNIKHRIDDNKKHDKTAENYNIDAMKKDYNSFVVAEQNEIYQHTVGNKQTVWAMGIKEKKVC